MQFFKVVAIATVVKTQNGYQAHFRALRALAHPVGLQILDILSRQEACVCHLGTALNRPQPYVSQQLATLRDAGLVQDRREGTLIFYRVADDRFLEWLAASREMVEEAAGAAGGRSSRPPRFRRPRRSRRPGPGLSRAGRGATSAAGREREAEANRRGQGRG